MEEIPLALILDDGVMSGPAYYWSKDNTLIGEWAIRIVTYSIAEQVRVTG